MWLTQDSGEQGVADTGQKQTGLGSISTIIVTNIYNSFTTVKNYSGGLTVTLYAEF